MKIVWEKLEKSRAKSQYGSCRKISKYFGIFTNKIVRNILLDSKNAENFGHMVLRLKFYNQIIFNTAFFNF